MSFKDFQQIIKNRIFSVIAFALMLVGAVYTIPLFIKSAFADVHTIAGGGVYIKYEFSGERLLKNISIMAVGILMIISLILLFIHIIRGEKRLLIAGGILCVLSAVMMLVLPADIQKALFNYEFINYRFSFMWNIMHDNSEGFDYFIKSLKFICPLAGAVLSVIGVVRQKDIPSEELQ